MCYQRIKSWQLTPWKTQIIKMSSITLFDQIFPTNLIKIIIVPSKTFKFYPYMQWETRMDNHVFISTKHPRSSNVQSIIVTTTTDTWHVITNRHCRNKKPGTHETHPKPNPIPTTMWIHLLNWCSPFLRYIAHFLT